VDINALYARAERAFAAGQHAAARADLQRVLKLAGRTRPCCTSPR
jgi:hypothetical protein